MYSNSEKVIPRNFQKERKAFNKVGEMEDCWLMRNQQVLSANGDG